MDLNIVKKYEKRNKRKIKCLEKKKNMWNYSIKKIKKIVKLLYV